ncbi:MAG: phosphoribosylglycinamide formyltransferase [Planctomycetota bacterium]
MTRVAVLISGSGTTLKNLIQRQAASSLPVELVLVISSKANAGGLRFAEQAQVPAFCLERRDFETTQAFSDQVFAACRQASIDLVVMGGFLCHLLIPADFQHRVMNIHPSLIPKYCGQGYYGLRVHRAVLDARETHSGCTVHFVDDEYDHGPIILQRSVPVAPEDQPEDLARRIFAAECELYPEAISLFAQGRLEVLEDQVRIVER